MEGVDLGVHSAAKLRNWKRDAGFTELGACGVDMNAIRDMVKTADYLSSSYSLASSENPYATIKDPPLPTSRNTECSYMEMKPPTRRDSSYAEISNSQRVDEADMSAETFPSSGAAFEHQQLGEELFDQAKNISCDYDLLPPRKDNYPSEPKEVDRD